MAPSSHAPAPTSARTSAPPPPSAPAPAPAPAPPAGCAAGSGSSSDAFAPIAAGAHTSCWDVTAEATADDPSRGGNQDLGSLADGAWAEYPHVDFGTGATQFLGRVASGAAAGISGRVEVHMDSLTSAPAAVFDIANTGGWQSWRTVPMNMNRTTGVHDVYVTFGSGQPQPFVSMHWFDFGN
ncbi:MAG: carbohydrate-binding protein [Catenulispora sp.]|nr:carbohydrate-binding protein [Catenulispora sp.]